LLERADATLAKLDAAASELTPERMKEIDKIMDDVAVTTANLRKMSESLAEGSEDVGPLLSHLGTILRRASGIDEKVIRDFLQKEGVHVTLGVPKKARHRIGELE
jgi:hypothetical protein